MEGKMLQEKDSLLPKLEKSVAEKPMEPPNWMLGYRLATEMLYRATRSCNRASARLTSGRRLKRSSILPRATDVGRLGKGCFSARWSPRLPGISPTKTLRLFSRAPILASKGGMLARVASNWASALVTSRLLLVPARDSSWVNW